MPFLERVSFGNAEDSSAQEGTVCCSIMSVQGCLYESLPCGTLAAVVPLQAEAMLWLLWICCGYIVKGCGQQPVACQLLCALTQGHYTRKNLFPKYKARLNIIFLSKATFVWEKSCQRLTANCG